MHDDHASMKSNIHVSGILWNQIHQNKFTGPLFKQHMEIMVTDSIYVLTNKPSRTLQLQRKRATLLIAVRERASLAIKDRTLAPESVVVAAPDQSAHFWESSGRVSPL